MIKPLSFLFFIGLITTLQAQPKDSIKVYLKCRNDILLNYLFKNYIPSEYTFQVRGARLIENRDNNHIAIMPDSAVVVIELRKKERPPNQMFLYSIKPPLPIFELKFNGKYISRTGPLPKSIEISPVPDEAFRENVPQDAIYKIQKWEISLIRGDKSINQFVLTSGTVPARDIDKIKSLARPGDVLQFKVLVMKRQNALEEMIDQVMPDYTTRYIIQ